MTAPARMPEPFDEVAASAFAETIGSTLNAAATTLMLSVGHRTGLLDIMAPMEAATSSQIAGAAGLSERYVREWLAAMVTSGIVRFYPITQTYELPLEHAACLTDGAALGNLAIYATMVSTMAPVEDRIVSCFVSGEGTRYDEYPHFHSVMAEDSAQSVVAHLFDIILPLAEGLTARLEQGIDVLDAGCGSGMALLAMAARYPESRFTGYDLCESAIAAARIACEAAGCANVTFGTRDLSSFEETGQYDLVTTFDAVHDQKDPQHLIIGLQRSLRSGGVYLMQDIAGSAHLQNNIDMPMAAFLYTVSCFHCMPVSLGQNGEGLGAMWGWETAERMLKEAGFATVDRHELAHDPMNMVFLSRKT